MTAVTDAQTGCAAAQGQREVPWICPHNFHSLKAAAASGISLGLITPANIEVVKRLNRASFPVSYSNKFYDLVVENRELGRLAFVNDFPVGAVCCRLEFDGEPNLFPCGSLTSSDEKGGFTEDLTSAPKFELSAQQLSSATQKGKVAAPKSARMVVLTLAVLPLYRRRGIGTKLLRWVQERCNELQKGTAQLVTGGIVGAQGASLDVSTIALHAWLGNPALADFYEGLGFKKEALIQNYYTNLEPPHAHLYSKLIETEAGENAN